MQTVQAGFVPFCTSVTSHQMTKNMQVHEAKKTIKEKLNMRAEAICYYFGVIQILATKTSQNSEDCM